MILCAQSLWFATAVGGFIVEHSIYTFVFDDFFLGIAPEITLLTARAMEPHITANFRQYITLGIMMLALAVNALTYARILTGELREYLLNRSRTLALDTNTHKEMIVPSPAVEDDLVITECNSEEDDISTLSDTTHTFETIELVLNPRSIDSRSVNSSTATDVPESDLLAVSRQSLTNSGASTPQPNLYVTNSNQYLVDNNSTVYDPANHRPVLSIGQIFIFFGCSIAIAFLNLTCRFLVGNKAEAEVINLALTDPFTISVLLPSVFVVHNADLRRFTRLKVVQFWNGFSNPCRERTVARSNSVQPIIVVS